MHQYHISQINERSFSFITGNGCEYHCYFYDFTSPFSDFPELSSKVFGFNLELKYKPPTLYKTGLDLRIAITTVTILKAFLNERINAVVYISDNSDNREKARFHKFTNWFKKYDDGSIIQLKGVIRAGNMDILNLMLIHRENEFLNDFIEAYQVLTGAYTKPDEDELENILNDDRW